MDGAIGEGVILLLECFPEFPQPRQTDKMVHQLDQVLLLCLLSVLAGAEPLTDTARFGALKLDLPRRF